MAERAQATIAAIHKIPQQTVNNSITLRIPKPNVQVVVLGLLAFITLFQAIQLVRISGNTSNAPVKVERTSTTSTGTNATGTGSDADTPQSMVGGC